MADVTFGELSPSLLVVLYRSAPWELLGAKLSTGPWPNAPVLRFESGDTVASTLAGDGRADFKMDAATVERLVVAHDARGGLRVRLTNSTNTVVYAYGEVRVEQGTWV